MSANKKYTEVKMQNSEGISTNYKNPLTKTYQYEYALLCETSKLFRKTVCRSQCIDMLKLYFNELPIQKQLDAELSQIDPQVDIKAATPGKKRTRESLMKEVRGLIARDIIGQITFPMMQECMAQVRVIPRNDGTHAFLFTDHVYAFMIRIEKIEKGHLKRIVVKSYKDGHAADEAACLQ